MYKVEYRNKSFSKFKYFFKKKYREGFLKYNLLRSENEIEIITIIKILIMYLLHNGSIS